MNKITKFLILVTVFSTPAYLIKLRLFGLPTNVLEILIYLTFISFVSRKPRINWKELYRSYRIYILPSTLIFIGLILSTLINQNYREGFGIIKGWFIDPIILAFIILTS